MIACIGCEEKPAPVYPAQREGTVHFEGDSVTWNTYYDNAVPYPGTSGEWLPGNRVDLSPWGGPGKATVDRLPQDLAAGNVGTLVWALGLNEIGSQKAWTDTHAWMWFDLLVNHVPDETCVVMVKPWITPLDTSRPMTAMNKLRTWIDQLAQIRPNVVVVDWKPILEANPHYSGEDGVHIVLGSGGAEARDAMYRDGIARCA
jgi:hypothetical protein